MSERTLPSLTLPPIVRKSLLKASIKDLEDPHWLIPKASNDENIRLLRRACRSEEKEYTPGVYFLCSHAGTHIMMLIFPSLDTVDV